MSFRCLLVAGLCLTLAEISVSAQTTARYTLAGIVRDTTGAVLVSVDVNLTPTDGGDTRTIVTDPMGRFTFPSLLPGAYRVSAVTAGFSEAASLVHVAAEPLTTVELVMHVVMTEHVEVSTSLDAPVATSLASTTLTGAALEALPDDPGALLQRVRELAGATDGVGQVAAMVDGFTGGLWLPPKQAIQAIRISSNWFAAEFAEPGQARIDIITKPGTNTVHGDLRVNVNNEAMNARNALATQHPSGAMRDVAGYLSGSLVPGRWSFVLYAGQWTQEQQHVINATVLDRAYLPVQQVETVTSPSSVSNLWFGTSYQLAPLHMLAISFSRTAQIASNLGLDSGLDLAERSYRRRASDRALRATVTSVPSTRLLNELRVQANPNESMVRADSSAPAVIVFDAFSGGGNQDALLSETRHRDVQLVDSVTLSVPRHTLKAGIDLRSARRRYRETTGFGGVFMFGASFDDEGAVISPLDNYRRTLLGLPESGPSQFRITRGNPDVRFRETSLGVFAQDDWIPTSRLTFSYGLRGDAQTAASQAGLGGRAGVAIAADTTRKNVIRMGAGTFYHRIEPELTLDIVRLDGRHQEEVRVNDPSFFPAVPANLGSVAASIPTIYTAASDLQAPQILMSAASYDRELPAGMFGTVKYSYQHGRDLFRTRNVNGLDVEAQNPEGGSRVFQYESTGRLRRHELSSGWRWTTGARGSFFANYSWVHGRSDTDGRSSLPADAGRIGQELGPTAIDRTHSMNAGANVTLAADVQISGYVTASSGRVFNITTGYDNNGDGIFTDRPALVAVDTPGAIHTPYGSLLASRPAEAVMLQRNAGRDPASVRFDLRASRAFRYRPGGALVVTASVENLLNRANFEGGNGVLTSSSFGDPKRAGSPRRISLSSGLSF
jgi:hypothetical protein